MKIIFFTILMSFSINGVAFNWKKVGEEDGNSFFIDANNIKKNNGLVHYWILINYPKSTKNGTFSDISEYKVDCVNEKQTWLSNTFFNKPMAKGEIITKANPVWNYYGSTLNEIRNLEPGSIEHNTMQKICTFTK